MKQLFYLISLILFTVSCGTSNQNVQDYLIMDGSDTLAYFKVDPVLYLHGDAYISKKIDVTDTSSIYSLVREALNSGKLQGENIIDQSMQNCSFDIYVSKNENSIFKEFGQKYDYIYNSYTDGFSNYQTELEESIKMLSLGKKFTIDGIKVKVVAAERMYTSLLTSSKLNDTQIAYLYYKWLDKKALYFFDHICDEYKTGTDDYASVTGNLIFRFDKGVDFPIATITESKDFDNYKPEIRD